MGESSASRSWHGSWIRPFLVGAVTFGVIHLAVTVFWRSGLFTTRLPHPWFLGSRATILLGQVAAGLAAFVCGMLESVGLGQRIISALALSLGFLGAAALVFAAIGPEALLLGPVHLWPWALLSAFLLVAPAIALGAAVAAFLQGEL
jgi:hypothetical protein